MFFRFSPSVAALLLVFSLGLSELYAGVAIRLDISRRNLKNFLTDADALASFQQADGTHSDLEDVFTLGSIDAPYAVFWDPQTCRLIGVLDIQKSTEQSTTSPSVRAESSSESAASSESKPESVSPYLFKAEGAFPLSKTAGAAGKPRYFGFRLIDGKPEFLYTCGTLQIEERIWLEEEGKSLCQRFSVKNATRGLQISLPSEWAQRVTFSAGTLKDHLLTIPTEAVGDITITYPLTPPPAPASTNASPSSN